MTPNGPIPQITVWFLQPRLLDGWPFSVTFSQGKRCCLRLPLGFGVTLGFPCLGWVRECSSTPWAEEITTALATGSLQPKPLLLSRDMTFWGAVWPRFPPPHPGPCLPWQTPSIHPPGVMLSDIQCFPPAPPPTAPPVQGRGI